MITYTQGLTIMAVCSLISIVMFFSGGLVIDSVYSNLYNTGFFALAGGWSDPDGLQGIINLYYLACLLIGLTGIGCFVLSLLKVESVDQVYR